MNDLLRILGNSLKIIGYSIILYLDPMTGSEIKVIGYLITFPWAVKHQLWDVVIIMAIFLSLDLVNVIRLW